MSHRPDWLLMVLTPLAWPPCALQLVSSDLVAPFGIDSIRVCNNFMFVGMSKEDEGIVKVYNLAAGGASHQLTGHKVGPERRRGGCRDRPAAALWVQAYCDRAAIITVSGCAATLDACKLMG